MVLIVDVANVMGSRPDGWWRDRAGAAARLVASLEPLVGGEVAGPEGDPLRVERIVAVVEGQARGVAGTSSVEVVAAPRDGDTTVVAVAGQVLAAGGAPLTVTADRGLRARLPAGAATAGPRWLRDLV